MTSLPVPLSPVIKMATSLGATFSRSRTTFFMEGLWKTGASPPLMVARALRRERASSLRRLCSRARSTESRSVLVSNGLFWKW